MSTSKLREGVFIHEISSNLLQVGSSPEHTVLFSNLSEDEKDWILSLRSFPRKRPPKKVETENQSGDNSLTERQQSILALLQNAGLLNTVDKPLSQLRVRIVGLNRVGIRLAELLVQGGLKHLDLRDSSPVDAEVEQLFPPEMKGHRRSNSLKEKLKQTTTLRLGRITYPDLVVTCNDRVWDHAQAGLLLSHDINHLPVVQEDRTIQVGPLISPGVTACAVCVDMHVRDMIPTWPDTYLALRDAPPVIPSHHLAAAAAGLTASMIESVALGVTLTPEYSPQLDARKTRFIKSKLGQLGVKHFAPSHSWRITQRGIETNTWIPHPDCSCSHAALANVGQQAAS